MPLVRTVVAQCDHDSCHTVHELSPNTTQPWRDLMEVGWSLDYNGPDILTFCPRHAADGD